MEIKVEINRKAVFDKRPRPFLNQSIIEEVPKK